MCKIHASFERRPSQDWAPKAGERVRVLYKGRSYEAVITQVLKDPSVFVVASDDLLMPVACNRDSLRPVDSAS